MDNQFKILYNLFHTQATIVKEAYESGDILGIQPHIEVMFSNPDDLTPLTQEEFIERIKTDDEFAEEWGELGPIYGAQWRQWNTKTLIKTTLKNPLTGNDTYVEGDKTIDQIQNLIDELKINDIGVMAPVDLMKSEEELMNAKDK
jgi:thymidylate synthase